MRTHQRFQVWLIVGVCLSLISACLSTASVDPAATSPRSSSFGSDVLSSDRAYQVLQEQILPQIQVESALIPDPLAETVVLNPLADPLPAVADFPLYGAQPSSDADTLYVEIFSSTEKATADRRDERWLVDVAEAFNQQRYQIRSQTVQVGVRNIPSGIAAQLIAAKTAQPAGYTPTNALWLEMLKSQGTELVPIESRLVPNQPGFLVAEQAYKALAAEVGEVTFDRLLDAILAGELAIGYPNPYASSTALNLLYTLLWHAAGRDQDQLPLTEADLRSPAVASVFEAFQQQVIVTTLTTLDLKDLFLRDAQKLHAFPIEYQSYVALKRVPDFAQTRFVPFGLPHDSPLVGFAANTPAQQAALEKFAEFATSAEMQQLAARQGFTAVAPPTPLPPLPDGKLLQTAQTLWKQRKDGGRAAYMMLVVDTSGSMSGEPLAAVQAGLQLALPSINPGNHVGLITFSDRPVRRTALAPFGELEHKRLVAAVQELEADGSTALYDAVMVGLGELMTQQKVDPDGRFYLLLLSDGDATSGLRFEQVRSVLLSSKVRVYPIAYGDVDQQELKEIAQSHEGQVYAGDPETVQSLLKNLLQTHL